MDNSKKEEKASLIKDEFKDAWSAIVEYVTDHDDDIELGINDFATLRPVLEFFNRNVEPFETIDYNFGESILK